MASLHGQTLITFSSDNIKIFLKNCQFYIEVKGKNIKKSSVCLAEFCGDRVLRGESAVERGPHT